MANSDLFDLVAWPALRAAMGITDDDAGEHMRRIRCISLAMSKSTGVLTSHAGWCVLWYYGASHGGTIRPVFCARPSMLTAEQWARHEWTFDEVFRKGAFPDGWLSPRRVMPDGAFDEARKRMKAVCPAVPVGTPLVARIPPNWWVIGHAEDLDDRGRPQKVRVQEGTREILKAFPPRGRAEGFDAVWRKGYREFESYMAILGTLAFAQRAWAKKNGVTVQKDP